MTRTAGVAERTTNIHRLSKRRQIVKTSRQARKVSKDNDGARQFDE